MSSNILDAITALQYEAQHFGFHPRNFLDLVYNAFYENLSASVMEMKQYMIQEARVSPSGIFSRAPNLTSRVRKRKQFKQSVPPFVIIKQTENFLQELVKALDKCIDKLEVYLTQNVFFIEPHVTLPEDKVHIKNPCTKEDEEKLDAEIEELKEKILVEKAKKFCLKKKISEQKQVKEMLLSLQRELRCLLTTANQEGVTPENIESLFTNLMKLLNQDITVSETENFETHPLKKIKSDDDIL